MKWEPVAAMIALLALGVWIVLGPSIQYQTRPGAELSRLQIGSVRGEVEAVRDAQGAYSFRMLFRSGEVTRVWNADEFKREFGEATYSSLTQSSGDLLFRALNVTSWSGVIWVLVGLGGQLAFAGRWLIQWWVSEKRRESHIPASFWWTSMVAGAILFAYFAWRQDLVGVLGQTSGIVVYARNIRLIRKKARRDARAATVAAAPANPVEQLPATGTPPPPAECKTDDAIPLA